jgi:hypothetical protein
MTFFSTILQLNKSEGYLGEPIGNIITYDDESYILVADTIWTLYWIIIMIVDKITRK